MWDKGRRYFTFKYTCEGQRSALFHLYVWDKGQHQAYFSTCETKAINRHPKDRLTVYCHHFQIPCCSTECYQNSFFPGYWNELPPSIVCRGSPPLQAAYIILFFLAIHLRSHYNSNLHNLVLYFLLCHHTFQYF